MWEGRPGSLWQQQGTSHTTPQYNRDLQLIIQAHKKIYKNKKEMHNYV